MKQTRFYCDPIDDLLVTYAQLAEEVAAVQDVPPLFHGRNLYEVLVMILAAIEQNARVALVPAGMPIAEALDIFESSEWRQTSGEKAAPLNLSLSPTNLAARSGGEETRTGQDAGSQAQDAITKDSELKTYDSGRKTQDSELKSEDSGLQTHDSRLRSQDSGLKTHDSRPHDLALGEQDATAMDILKKIRESDCRIGVFTSGTTGRPKLIWHAMNTLARAVRVGEKHANDVWGFAYSPSHFAGLQVFLQALSNRNPIVRLIGVEIATVHQAIENHQVTNLSATPTFFKMLCDGSQIHQLVRSVTLGGERMETSQESQLKVTFPNARIRNIYASTEAGSLLIADQDEFQIPNEHSELVKIIDGELAIHRSLLAGSLQATLDDDFFFTGDQVTVTCESPLRFRVESRRSDFINVGGYKVNPHKVEAAIQQLPDVQAVRVYPQANSVTGHIVCCEIVPQKGTDLTAKSIKRELAEVLQRYEIPQVIHIVEELQTTATGKKKR